MTIGYHKGTFDWDPEGEMKEVQSVQNSMLIFFKTLHLIKNPLLVLTVEGHPTARSMGILSRLAVLMSEISFAGKLIRLYNSAVWSFVYRHPIAITTHFTNNNEYDHPAYCRFWNSILRKLVCVWNYFVIGVQITRLGEWITVSIFLVTN